MKLANLNLIIQILSIWQVLFLTKDDNEAWENCLHTNSYTLCGVMASLAHTVLIILLPVVWQALIRRMKYLNAPEATISIGGFKPRSMYIQCISAVHIRQLDSAEPEVVD